MKKIRNFLKNRSGATAVTFALMLIPIAGVTGLAVDYTRASNDRAELQNAADTAVLSGAQIYDGKDLKPVDKRILESLKANITDYDKRGITKTVTESPGLPPRIVLNLTKSMDTTFMKVLSRNSMNIGVTAVASSALSATDATFTVTNVKGTYYKKISMIVVREDGTKEEVAKVEYTNAQQTDGKGISDPPKGQSKTFSLGKFKYLYFTMLVKKDGCPLGQLNDNNKESSKRKCKPSDDATAKLTPIPSGLSFDDETKLKNGNSVKAFMVQSDNPRDAWRFIEGVGMSVSPKNSDLPIDISQLMDCTGSTKYHGWEDGGGTNTDFEYRLTTGCAYDYSKVLLTQ